MELEMMLGIDETELGNLSLPCLPPGDQERIKHQASLVDIIALIFNSTI